MLFLARIGTTALFLWLVVQARDQALTEPGADIANAWNFVLVILSGIAMSTTWAPLLGKTVAGPITGLYVDGSIDESGSRSIRLIRWCERRNWKFATRLLCFLEGIRHPYLPAAFVMGLRNSVPGSWLEKVYAREVYRFDNVAHAVKALDILKGTHHVDPGPHRHLEVRLVLLERDREPRAELPPLSVPPAPPPPPLQRNQRIKLFANAEKADANSVPEQN